MKISQTDINRFQNCLFEKNVKMNPNNSVFITPVKDNYCCIITKKIDNSTQFFTHESPDNMNPFYRQFIKMMLSDNINGDGCFDYESSYKGQKKDPRTVISKVNSYFDSQNNFVLVRLNKKSIVPVSFLTYNNNYIWNVCTGLKYRSKGLMTILLDFVFKLCVDNPDIFVNNSKLEEGVNMWLLKSNPDFEKIKTYYLKHEFNIIENLDDKIILFRNITL